MALNKNIMGFIVLIISLKKMMRIIILLIFKTQIALPSIKKIPFSILVKY